MNQTLPRITTDRFRLGAGVHARQALTRWACRFWYALALPVAVLVVMGFFYDSRMLFIAGAIIFILFPTLLFIGWHRALTRPCAVAALFPQTFTLGPDNIIDVEYAPLPGSESGKAPAELTVTPEELRDCRVMGDNIIITYGDSQDLIVPFRAFRSQADAGATLSRLTALLPQRAD